MGIKFNPFTGQFDIVGTSSGGTVTSVNGDAGPAVQLDAIDIPYDNVVSGLTAVDVQAAIDELAASPAGATIELDNLGVTAVNADINPGVDDTISIGSSALQFSEGHFTPATLGTATGLMPDTWGTDIPGLIIDGTTAAADSANAAGIIFKGSQSLSNFIIATQDRSDANATASLNIYTGASTGNKGTGSIFIGTGFTDSAEDTGGFTWETGGNAGAGNSGGFSFLAGQAGALRGDFYVDARSQTASLLASNDGAFRIISADGSGSIPLRLHANGTGNYVGLVSPASLLAPYTLTLPVDDGASGEVLSTDGSGVLSWISVGAPTGTIDTVAFFDSAGNLDSDATFGYVNADNSLTMGTAFITGGALTSSFILGVGHDLDATSDIQHSIVIGDTNEIYNSIYANIIGGSNNILGNAPYGLDTSLIVGDSNDIIASTSVVGGQSNIVTVGMSNNLLVGTSNNLAAQVTNSVVTGSSNVVGALSSGAGGSIISGQQLNAAAGQIGNSIITGQQNTLNASLTNSIMLGSLNTLTNAAVSSIIAGTSITSLGLVSDNNILTGDTITVGKTTATVRNNIITGLSSSYAPTGNFRNNIIGGFANNTGASSATIQHNLIVGNGHTLNATNLLNNLLGGDGYTITGANVNSNVVGGTGGSIAGSAYNLIVGNANLLTTSSTVGNVVGGASNTVGSDCENNLVGGASNVLGTGTRRSVVVGMSNAISSNVFNTLVAGQSITAVGGASNINNSLFSGTAYTVPSNSHHTIISGTTHTFNNVSHNGSIVTGSTVNVSGLTNALLVGDACTFTAAGLVSSVVVGKTITSDTNINYSVIVGEGHSIDTSCDHNAVFGKDNIVSDFTGLLLAGNAQESSRDYQTLVGDSFLSSSDTMFGIGGGAAGNLFEVTDVGLVKRDAGGLRVRSRSDAAATVTVDAETDYAVICTNGGAVTVNLPAGVDGMEYKIKARGATTATVTPAAGNIDGAATYPLAAEEGVILVYNTGEWSSF